MEIVTVYSGRESVDALLREHGSRLGLAPAEPCTRIGASSLCLVPSAKAGEGVRSRMASSARDALLSPGVVTSQQLASRLLALSGNPATTKPLDRPTTRRVLAAIVQQRLAANRLRHYGRLEPLGALLDLLEREIDHASLRGMTAQHPAEESHPLTGRQREFAELYAEFHKQTRNAGFLDRAGRWLEAARLLDADGSPRWKHVYAAPLEAASRAEQAFFAAVFRSAHEVHVACEEVPLWLNELAGPVTRLPTPHEDATNNDVDALAFVRRELFGESPADPQPVVSALRVFAGTSAQGEIDWIAGEVKRWLLDGHSASELLIATPNPRVLADRARHAFDRVGVPLAIDVPTRLEEAPVARALLAILALPTADWRHDDVLRVLSSPAFGCFDHADSGSVDTRAADSAPSRGELFAVGLAGPRAATELAVRRLLLPRGRDALIDQLRRDAQFAADRLAEEGDPGRVDRRSLLACRTAVASLTRLADIINSLPKAAEPLVWFDVLRQLLNRLGYTPAEASECGEKDLAALEAIEEAFASLERLARYRGRAVKKIDLATVTDLLADWAPRLTIETTTSDEGRVQLMSIDQAAHERPRVLFVAGLVEGSLPRPLPAADPLATTTADARTEHTRQEMQRFRELLSSASESIVLSFPGLDDKAQPLNPSSFVAEVERLFLPGALRSDPDNQPVVAWSPTALRRGAIRELMAGEDQGLRRLAAESEDTGRVCAVLDGVTATLNRSTGDDFGANEGVMVGDAARRDFASRFGPDHLWSPSQLELYAECPFKFFMRYGLGAEPLDPLAVNLDYRRRGSLLHDAMVRFHQSTTGKPEPLADLLTDERFFERFEQAVADAAEAIGGAPHERPLARVEALQATAWGPAYREQLTKYDGESKAFDEPMRPAYFEARFGPSRRGEETDRVLSTDEPFRLPLDEEELLLTGRIDRIDVGVVDGRVVFNVIDYKTKKDMKASVADARSGRQLQLYLYALAAERLLLRNQQAAPWRIGYWAVRDKGFLLPKQEDRKPLAASELSDGQLLTSDAWQTLGEDIGLRLREIVTGIRAAQFPMHNADDKCTANCDYRGVCRIAQARGVGKVPPLVELSPTIQEKNSAATPGDLR